MEIIYIITGLVIGLIFGWLIATFKAKSGSGKIEERASILEQGKKEAEENLSNERNKVIELNSKLSSIQTQYSNLKENEQQLLEKFENLANKIFEDNTNKFSERSKSNLSEILNPLKERINEFQSKVEETNKESIKGNVKLYEQIQMLKDMNLQITQEAKNLTEALKGQSKTQGNWGEFILESILEKSGLVKGREYLVQESLTTESGKRYQLDVIIKLPENQSIVIDSKVSLVGYEKFASSDNEQEKQIALREHINSIRAHIKNLSSKNYQNLYQLDSLDFVLMFMPIEPAFALAVQNDQTIFNDAFEMNIVIVSPSTLLATLRTIANIWKQEYQNRNVLEIAKQSGALYDKFVGFVDDLVNVGNRIDQAKSGYVDAMKKLSDGSGNLVNRAEKIKKLGAKTSKSLPQSILNRAEIEEENN
jgi:DNA recombination protein RmuC